MKKKILSMLLAAIMVFALTACGGNSSSTSSDGGSSDEGTSGGDSEIMIGFSYPTVNNEFWVNALDYVEQASEELGFELIADDCNNDQAEQITDVDSMVSSGIDALVLAPQDASVCAGIADTCKSNDIDLVIVDRWPGDDLVAGEDYICFIGPDDEDAGYQMANALIDAGCTQIVGLGGYQGTSVAENRKAGLDKALAEHPEVELLQFEYAGENWDEGDTTFRNLYQAHPEVDGVWCYNDSLALASVNVLKEEGRLADVKVGGMDLLAPAVESMQAGELFFSIGGHYLQAAFGAVVAFDAASGEEYTGEDRISLSLMAVTQDEVDTFAESYLSGESPIDFTELSKVTNPDADYVFELSFE